MEGFKKITAFAGIFFLGVLLLGCVQGGEANSANETQSIPTPELTSAEQELVKYPELAGFIKSYQQVGAPAQRPDYLPSIVFSKLPPFPRDFYSVDLLVENGIFSDMKLIEEAYWKQPEFYPEFERQAVLAYQKPPTDRWAAFGIGSYPSEVGILSPRNNVFEVNFFIHTSWLVQTYQGTRFNYGFPAKGELLKSDFPDGTRNVTQDPEVVAKYFDVEITPREILLEPAFPVFEPNWVQKITVRVKVKDAPPGRYYIAIGSQSPSKEKADEWLWKYKTRYTDAANSFGGVIQPWLGIFIDIT
ncbi:MAG: hypothetical protein QXR53_02985 [Candidatus Norongarragalinales archaeon]